MKLYELFNKKVFHIDLGLDRIKKALNDLENPQNYFKSVLISGTNGKGSTSAFLESLLRHSGFKVGLFTSPHLIDERERWQINRTYISKEKLNRYIEIIKPLIEKYELTYFEASTILAFLYFKDENIDIAVLEVGLGGRYDATNVVYPELSIITNVGLDHTHILGDTLDKIAFEKLGIAREEIPLVLGSNQPELVEQAKSMKIKSLFLPYKDYWFKTYYEDMKQKVDYRFKDTFFEGLETNLIGKRQGNNLATALTGYIILMERLNKSIDKNKVHKAVFNTKWKGRMEIVSKNPTVVIDGAHNEEALLKTYSELTEIFNKKSIITVISFMKDKNFNKLIDIAKEFSKDIVFVETPFDRGVKIKDLKKDYGNLKYLENIHKLKDFINKNVKKDEIVLITGSLYFIGEVLKSQVLIPIRK